MATPATVDPSAVDGVFICEPALIIAVERIVQNIVRFRKSEATPKQKKRLPRCLDSSDESDQSPLDMRRLGNRFPFVNREQQCYEVLEVFAMNSESHSQRYGLDLVFQVCTTS